MPTAHQQPQQKTLQKSAPISSGSGDHSQTPASQLPLGSHSTTTSSTSENSSQNPTDPAFPFDAEVTITSVFDKGDGNRSFDAQSQGGKALKVWRPDEGDFSHLSLIQKGDTVKVTVLGHARKPGEWRSHLLPRDKQTNGFQTELRRREQGQQGKLTHVEAEISPADHACLQYAHKLEKRVRPSLTQAEYVRELLVGSLHPVRALWLSQQEGQK